MPITPYLNGERFEAETKRVLGVAFEQVCIALRIGNSDDDVKQAIANKVIELAKAGERNPDILCEVRTAAAGSLAGIFGPRSMTWRADREVAIFWERVAVRADQCRLDRRQDLGTAQVKPSVTPA
jgi:hypothetical protein